MYKSKVLMSVVSCFQQLCLVTLSLFWTLVDLNCEDLMLTLVFQYLAPCTHVMLSQRQHLTRPPEPAQRASHKLLHLIPEACQVSSPSDPILDTVVPYGAGVVDCVCSVSVVVKVVVCQAADSRSPPPCSTPGKGGRGLPSLSNVCYLLRLTTPTPKWKPSAPLELSQPCPRPHPHPPVSPHGQRTLSVCRGRPCTPSTWRRPRPS